MKKMRTFDIGNRKAKLFELFLKANKYIYVANSNIQLFFNMHAYYFCVKKKLNSSSVEYSISFL